MSVAGHDVVCSARRSVPARAARRGVTAGARWGGRGRCWPLRCGARRARGGAGRDVHGDRRGDYHTCAITTDGTAVCWGYNGDGETTIPPNLGSVTQITAGGYHTCAITTDGSPVCWGYNNDGQTTIPPNLGSVTQISAGDYHTCAITTAGTPACWGYNSDGQTTIPPNLGSVTQITAGGYHTCAITTAGTPVCWGDNDNGQTTIPQNLGSVTQITAGAYHTCAITTTATPACWGYNIYGQTTIPPNLGSVTQITAGGYHTCAITTAATPVCWGDNGYGQTTIPPNLGSVTQINAGDFHTCALRTDDSAVCWGDNEDGQSLVPPHNTTRPQITGAPKVGSNVAATNGAWDNSPTGFTYAWLRCTTNNTLVTCTTIPGADQAGYTIAAADDTRYLRVVVTATNASGSVAQHSYPVKTTRVKPDNTARPLISGTPKVGNVLTATSGHWANSPTGYTYAWQRCTTNNALASCTPIAGADQTTYTLSAATTWPGSGSSSPRPTAAARRSSTQARPCRSRGCDPTTRATGPHGHRSGRRDAVDQHRGVGQRARRLHLRVEALHDDPARLMHDDRRRHPRVLHPDRRRRRPAHPRVRHRDQQRRQRHRLHLPERQDDRRRLTRRERPPERLEFRRLAFGLRMACVPSRTTPMLRTRRRNRRHAGICASS